LDEDENVKFAVLTGEGKFYSAGNDINNFSYIYGSEDGTEMSRKVIDNFVKAFIEFKKPLIAVCNGPAIGISATTLALCDAVWASDEAYFLTPFTKLAQGPEGCSSSTFPKIMGSALASEMLLFNKQMSAQEAKDCGLVSRLISSENFEEEVNSMLKEIADLPPQAMILGKSLVKNQAQIDHLLDTATAENYGLKERWESPECKARFMK
ncbi:unnamed protein product, partial [Oikopleura dioica]